MTEDHSPAPDDFAAMSAPGDEHALLSPFVGTFAAEVKLWMGPGDPEVSTGTMTNKLDLGGRFLEHTYEGDPNEGPFPEFAGRGWWGYNKIDQRWEGMWIDTASTAMQLEQGEIDVEGKVWTMRGEMTNPMTGQPISKRSVMTLIDDDRHSMEMFFETPDGDMKGMEIQYVRKPA